MRADVLNWHDYGGDTEMHSLSSAVFSTGENESKQRIINKTLLQNYSLDVDEPCSTEIDISEYTITEQKDSYYEESSVTKEVPIYFNIFECGGNLLDRLDVTYERACCSTRKTFWEENFTGKEMFFLAVNMKKLLSSQC